MKYRGFYIDETETSDVQRFNEKGSVKCDGIWFRLYADPDYSIQLDDFTAAYEFDMERSDEGIEKFLISYIDKYYPEYKEKQFKALLEADYKAFVYDVKEFDKDYDIIDNAEQIADIKRAYENLSSLKSIPLETMEYIVTLKRPLETICDYFIPDANQFVKEFAQCINEVASEKRCNYGMLEEYEQSDEKDITNNEPKNGHGMTMQ